MSTRAMDMEPVQLPAGINPRALLSTPTHYAPTPNQNQTKHCFAKYNEFFRCARVHGEEKAQCLKLKEAYFALCPLEWIEKWDEQREAGTFPGPQ
eukprot:CAMPEP_0196717102 /NCGR_PEP_ID=MMETSP1091-20130531/512_1 /TAXON_ID=302021 /ORGANISM="Rhodomonas sp., Strain CCMP768" /LENGTH=94 /DNA_ID=CAMNT_0042057327 /DNA_START=39 /DNA_END=323 /DNA_ORIENTATION=-